MNKQNLINNGERTMKHALMRNKAFTLIREHVSKGGTAKGAAETLFKTYAVKMASGNKEFGSMQKLLHAYYADRCFIRKAQKAKRRVVAVTRKAHTPELTAASRVAYILKAEMPRELKIDLITRLI